MKEPKKIKLNTNAPTQKEIKSFRLEPLRTDLYDDFGYITSIILEDKKNQNENTEESTET
jgi:hypothetical protein